ncbi:aminotransferase class IV [Rhodococcus opacus]|uniref:aminotransferase class IV n=1 Tax=Rhodococcus opacus TaxID=37919 RepID=UPI00155B0E1C|nr:aminotransferase class IV [Rhodococcus opacus]
MNSSVSAAGLATIDTAGVQPIGSAEAQLIGAGAQLMETMYHDPRTGLRHAERHLRRLARSAAVLGYEFGERDVRRRLAQRLSGVGAARVRVRLHRDGGVDVDIFGPPVAPTSVSLVLDDEPVDSRDILLGHKTTLRERYDRRRHRHPGAGDVVLVNELGHVTETTIANLAARIDGVWWTPPLASGCLPGVERSWQLDRGLMRERILTPGDLLAAEALAVTSSLKGVLPATLRL